MTGAKNHWFRNLYKMGRKGTKINLKSTSPEGEVKYFKSFPEATRELGFSEVGVRKAYYAKRDRIGQYRLEWLKPEAMPEEIFERLKKKFCTSNCIYCNEKLEKKDRVDYCFSILILESNGHLARDQIFTSLYEASKETGLSLCSLINAAEQGNFKTTRRKDKKEFLFAWNSIHKNCFELRKAKRREEEREADVKEWQEKRKN